MLTEAEADPHAFCRLLPWVSNLQLRSFKLAACHRLAGHAA